MKFDHMNWLWLGEKHFKNISSDLKGNLGIWGLYNQTVDRDLKVRKEEKLRNTLMSHTVGCEMYTQAEVGHNGCQNKEMLL